MANHSNKQTRLNQRRWAAIRRGVVRQPTLRQLLATDEYSEPIELGKFIEIKATANAPTKSQQLNGGRS